MISIITATYNAETYLQDLITSIIPQKTSEVEFIIVDGGSSDKTLDIIKDNESYIDYWISELDAGTYDAWNKGIKVAKGEWIMFLGADDILLPGALKEYLHYISKIESYLDLISSKLDYVNEKGIHLKYVGEPWNWGKFKMSNMSFAHPGMLHNIELFRKYGLFDTFFKICGDSELLLRTNGNITTAFLDVVTVRMRQGGKSFSTKAIIESYWIRKKNHTISTTINLYRLLIVFCRYNLSKIKQKLLMLT